MASSRRTIGTGRVLGTAKPTTTTSPAVEPSAAREPPNAALLSPSESTVSLQSHGSSSTPRTLLEENDISSSATRDIVSSASASSRLVCPICNEEMVTLLQLNRHLDSEHQELENQEQDEVINWFRSQMVKAKNFQPLVALNQRIKGLDAFESNENQRSAHQSPRLQPSSGTATPEPIRQDPDELVTKNHWQRYTRDGLCSDPMCDHRLGGSNGNINCRSCGKLFCEEHSMYQMKLSRSAQWEPVRGFWCRVCETCFKSRDGYNDHTGFERDHTKDFASIRRTAVDKAYLDVSRLEKRLTKLTQLLANPALHEEQGIVGYLWSWSSGAPTQRRLAEQTIVDWEDDASVAKCPFCMQEFTAYSFKRHHCRLCGRVVCADPTTQCSSEVPLTVASAAAEQQSEKTPQQIPVDVRMCQECKRTVFSKADFDRQLAETPADQRSFKNLKEFERGISAMLPRFQKLLTALQDPDTPPTPTQLNEAARVRKRLTDSFTQYTMAAQRIRDLPTTSPTQKRLQTQIYAQASNFLHIHMLPLKALPKTLKQASSRASHHHQAASSSSSTSHQVNGHLSASPAGPSAAQAQALKRPGHSPSPSHDSSRSSALSSLEGEEKDLRERLIVLEEQKVMVGEMLAEARRRRKVEEVESLRRNLDDLSRECDSVTGQLEGLRKEFEGLYVGDGSLSSAAPAGAGPSKAAPA